jgi:hypothetical protein
MFNTEVNVSTGEIIQIPLTDIELEEVNQAQATQNAKNAELAKTEYQRQRAAEYPSITDYIDGIVKGDTAQVQAYIDACLAIKAKYPKP